MKLPALTKKRQRKKASTGLYATLGVSNDATTKQIQAAFRKVVKGRHPDHGGTEEDFTLLLNAYRILRDPRKRKLYDETGEVEETLASNDFATMVEGLIQLFQSVLASDLPERLDADLIQAMKNGIARNLTSIELEEKSTRANTIRLEALKKRLIRKTKGENLFTNILDKKISALLKAEKTLKGRRRILLLAQEELDNYACVTEVIDIVRYYSFPSTTATSVGTAFT